MKEHIKALRHWTFCGEFARTGEIPAQRVSNADNVSIWWRHHASGSVVQGITKASHWGFLCYTLNQSVDRPPFKWIWKKSVLVIFFVRFVYPFQTSHHARTTSVETGDNMLMDRLCHSHAHCLYAMMIGPRECSYPGSALTPNLTWWIIRMGPRWSRVLFSRWGRNIMDASWDVTCFTILCLLSPINTKVILLWMHQHTNKRLHQDGVSMFYVSSHFLHSLNKRKLQEPHSRCL